MKKALKLRPLEERMNDSYTPAELYAAFRDQVFRRGRNMDVALLRETVLALDDSPVPSGDAIWEDLQAKIANLRRRVFGLTRRGMAVLVTALVLLLTAVALAVSNWNALLEWIYRMEKESPVATWTLEQKQQVADGLREIGYNMDTLPDLTSMNDLQRDRALTDWLRVQFQGEVTDGGYNLLTQLKGFYDDWSLTDKAWFSGLLLQIGEIEDGEFVSTVPHRGPDEAARAVALAQIELEKAYAGTDTDIASLTPYTFYGYFYPIDDVLYWRIHYRNQHLENWFTVLVQDSDPAHYQAQVIYQRPTDAELAAGFARQTARNEKKRKLWEQLEAERGPLITWTFEQQAEFFPDDYGVPGPEDMTFEEACDIARDAYCDYLAVPREEADKLYCFAYFITNDGKPYYAVNFFYNEGGIEGPGQSVNVYIDGTVEFFGQANG